MIAEEHLSRSRLYRRLRNGHHRELVERYAARLVEVGLAHQRTCRSLRLISDLLSWIANSRSELTDLDERMVDRYTTAASERVSSRMTVCSLSSRRCETGLCRMNLG